MRGAVVAQGQVSIGSGIPVPVPKDSEVLLRVYATALNRADILQRKGG